MSGIGASGKRPEGRLLDDVREAGGPAVPRLVLGARLLGLREDRGLTRADAGRAVGVSEEELGLLELGRTACRPGEIAGLLALYGIGDEAERGILLALADQAGASDWWEPYAEVIPAWRRAFLGLERAARVIRLYEGQFVPGLLQTPDYARTVLTLADPEAPRAEIERRVEVRMLRSRVLHRIGPPHLWALVDEAVLRRAVGGAVVMRDQLDHLTAVCELPHVTVQILPFEAEGRPAESAVTMLRMPADEVPDVVYLEQLTGASYPGAPDDLLRYRHLMNRLAAASRPPTETRTLLRWIREET